MPDDREWLRPKAFGDRMPIILTLDESGTDTPWFWSDPSKTFDAGSKQDQAPVWLFHVTSQDNRQWTLDGNLKMTRAIAAMEMASGALGVGATFTLEKQVVGAYSADADLNDEVADLVFSGRLRVDDLVSHTFSLDDAPEAFALARSPVEGSLKVVVTMTDGQDK